MATTDLKGTLYPFLGILEWQWVAAGKTMREHTEAIAACSDTELVEKTLADADYYGHLVARYEAPLDRYIRRLGVFTHEDRQDVLQEIFIKAYRNLNSFNRSLKFSSWLYRIAHNEAISWYRKRSVRPEGHLVDDGETVLMFTEAAELQPDAASKARLNSQALETALEQLPEKYREILILRFFEHKEYDEISDILRIPVGTVGTLIHRGKARLEKLLSTEEIDV